MLLSAYKAAAMAARFSLTSKMLFAKIGVITCSQFHILFGKK
jgi:hypothetical protein